MAKAARNRGAVKSGGGRQVPGWVWLFSGIVTGLFIAFLVHLAQLQRENPPAEHPTADDSQRQPDTEQPPQDGEKGPQFDFYAVLPDMEVIVPEGEKERSADDSPAEDGDDADRQDLSHRHDEHFLLQAGSFGQAEDADRRRAELTLQGYNVRIQQAEMDDGRRFHRVMVGPFDNINTMHKAQDKLANAGIDTLPIRKKSGGDEAPE